MADAAGFEPSYAQSGLITASALSGILQHAVTNSEDSNTRRPSRWTSFAGEYLFQLPGSSLIFDPTPPLGTVTPWSGHRYYQKRDKQYSSAATTMQQPLSSMTSHPITVLVGTRASARAVCCGLACGLVYRATRRRVVRRKAPGRSFRRCAQAISR